VGPEIRLLDGLTGPAVVRPTLRLDVLVRTGGE
jgi:hypothetical protein